MVNMDKIKSFTIDHDSHGIGFYFSGESNGVYTYDMRFKTPNAGDYISQAALHTVEHLFATAARNGKFKDDVVYFGPMGCRTGFYFLLYRVEGQDALEYTMDCLERCLETDAVPGNTRKECGNYAEHDLEAAKKEIRAYRDALRDIR